MSTLNISSFIWGIADDVLRDIYVRGKYRDVILPMTVIRRLDAVLEPTKDAVLRMKAQLDDAGITNQDRALRQASGEAFYNTSSFRLRDLTSIGQQQRLRANFEVYLDGFSPNIQEVLDKFKFHNQIPTLVDTGTLGFLLEKFLNSSINLSPKPILNGDGTVRLDGLDNHGMGTVFEELIRRWIIENDWLEAIVALPLNMFYNTGIATYIWVLSNRKAEHRRGKVQLIDATQWSRPLRKNLGSKNCELSDDDIRRICDAFLAFEETEQSKIFPNEAFGYWKVTVERPLRLTVDLSPDQRQRFRAACRDAKEEPLSNVIDRVATVLGTGPHPDFNRFMEVVGADASAHGVKLTAKRKNLLQMALASREEAAAPVIKKTHKPGAVEPDPIRGLIEAALGDRSAVVEYEPDTGLRDTEQVPLLHEGGIEAFIHREVLPYAPDAWYDTPSVKVGYEISFTRHFYMPQPLRPLEEIRGDILALEQETEGLLAEIVGVGK